MPIQPQEVDLIFRQICHDHRGTVEAILDDTADGEKEAFSQMHVVLQEQFVEFVEEMFLTLDPPITILDERSA